MSDVAEKWEEAVPGSWEWHRAALLTGHTHTSEKIKDAVFKRIECEAILDNDSLDIDSMFNLVVLFATKKDDRSDDSKREFWLSSAIK